MKNYFNFSHPYYKLQQEKFTTIRGRDAFEDYKTGQIVEILLQRYPIKYAKIWMKEKKKIKDIPTHVLKADCEYEGFVLEKREDFITLLNSFREYYKIESEEEVLTIFYLKTTEKEPPHFSSRATKQMRLNI